MHTVLAGTVLVMAAYIAQTALVATLFGAWWALSYLLSLPAAASIDLRLGDRLRRARARVRAYLAFRADASLHRHLRDEVAWLREEALALEQLATAAEAR